MQSLLNCIGYLDYIIIIIIIIIVQVEITVCCIREATFSYSHSSNWDSGRRNSIVNTSRITSTIIELTVKGLPKGTVKASEELKDSWIVFLTRYDWVRWCIRWLIWESFLSRAIFLIFLWVFSLSRRCSRAVDDVVVILSLSSPSEVLSLSLSVVFLFSVLLSY